MSVSGSVGSLKITVTAAREGTWPTAFGPGVNSRPRMPGGPGTGSCHVHPVVKDTMLSPAAIVIGLPSSF